MAIALHPYLYGAPHRIRFLDKALAYIKGHSDVWWATGQEIADHYLTHWWPTVEAHLAAREG